MFLIVVDNALQVAIPMINVIIANRKREKPFQFIGFNSQLHNARKPYDSPRTRIK
jgi:hypothetical protein